MWEKLGEEEFRDEGMRIKVSVLNLRTLLDISVYLYILSAVLWWDIMIGGGDLAHQWYLIPMKPGDSGEHVDRKLGPGMSPGHSEVEV